VSDSLRFGDEEWNKLGKFTRMRTNKKEFIKSKSEEYFQSNIQEVEINDEEKNDDEKEQEEQKIREEELMKIAVTFSNEEWNQLGYFKRMDLNKGEFIKIKSEEYYQNHLEVELNNEEKNGDEKEQEERKIREEEDEGR